MRAAVLAEVRKTTGGRLWWLLALGMLGYLALVGGALAASIALAPETSAAPLAPRDAALTIYGSLNALGYVFPLVVGTLSVTSEVRHRTLTQTLLSEPARGVVLSAKLLAALPFGLLYGVAGALGLVLAAGPVLAVAGDGAFLGDGEVLRTLLLGVLVTGLWAVLGVALGTLVTHQVAAVVVVLGFTQLVEPVARAALSAVEGLDVVGRFLPGAAADAVVGTSVFDQVGGGSLLPVWAGLLVLAAYAVVLAVAGWRTTWARDVT
ncbi:MAG: ABC transporter permease [Nocardioides sp.]|nr:ABC transporter permease [Nocardioides sp.]